MIKKFRETVGTWVFSMETTPALPIGKIVDMVIDPFTGKCVALWIKSIDGLRLIDFRDIKRWTESIYIPSIRDVLKPEDFPRISDVLDREVPIIGADVFVQEGKISRKIGKVEDFSFQANFLLLLSLKVNTGWWIFGKKIEIPRNRILEISSKGIRVIDNLIKIDKKITSSSAVPSLD